MKIGQYCQRQRCKHVESEQFWHAFASRGFVSDSWAFLSHHLATPRTSDLIFFNSGVLPNILHYITSDQEKAACLFLKFFFLSSSLACSNLVINTLWVKKNCATFIFTVTLANVGRFLKFFQCRNQKEMAYNKNEKFPTVA